MFINSGIVTAETIIHKEQSTDYIALYGKNVPVLDLKA